MDCEANVESSENLRDGPRGQITASESRRLDCIYDNEPLGFEKDPQETNKKIQAHDPLEKVDLGDGAVKRPTYISAKIKSSMKKEVVELLKEFKDCFSRDDNKMAGLSRDMVELKVPIRSSKNSVK